MRVAVSVLVFAVVMFVGGAAHAQLGVAGINRVGPVNPDNGFPMWIEDSNGLKLAACDSLGGECFFAAPDPLAPLSFPGNYPDELFWWAADGFIDLGDGRKIILVMALEGAFFNGPVVEGEQVSFSRVRIRIEGLTMGETYTVTYPFGVETFVVGQDAGPGAAAGPGISFVRDIGITEPGVFDGLILGDVGPFLTWTNYVMEAPIGFISDGATPHTVTGSPLGTNFFRVEGLDVGGPGVHMVETDQFIVQGKLADRFGVQIDRASIAQHADPVTGETVRMVDVWASSASIDSFTRSELRASIPGIIGEVVMTEKGTTGNYYARIDASALAADPVTVMVTNITDNPPSQKTLAIRDSVTNVTAVYTIDSSTGLGTLLVRGDSTDKSSTTASLSANWSGNTTPLSLGTISNGTATASATAMTTPPRTVTVTSSLGGSTEVEVTINGGGELPSSLGLVAIAGADQIVLPGDLVQLSGSTSLGNIVSYAWSQVLAPGEVPVALSAPGSANTFFTFPPTISGTIDLEFLLTVTAADGGSATDSVIIQATDLTTLDPDVLVFTTAFYNEAKDKWRIEGTSSSLNNQLITAYLGDPAAGIVIGQTLVDAVGAWSLRTGRDSGPDGLNPVPATTIVTVISELGGTATTVYEIK